MFLVNGIKIHVGFFISGSGLWWCHRTTPAFSYFCPHHFPTLPISLTLSITLPSPSRLSVYNQQGSGCFVGWTVMVSPHHRVYLSVIYLTDLWPSWIVSYPVSRLLNAGYSHRCMIELWIDRYWLATQTNLLHDIWVEGSTLFKHKATIGYCPELLQSNRLYSLASTNRL